MTITDQHGAIHASDGKYATKGQSEPQDGTTALGDPPVTPALTLDALHEIAFRANDDFDAALIDLRRAENAELEMALAHLDSIDNLETVSYDIEKGTDRDGAMVFHARIADISTRDGYSLDTLPGGDGHQIKAELRHTLERVLSVEVMQRMYNEDGLGINDGATVTADYSRQPEHLDQYDRAGAQQRCNVAAMRALNADRARLAQSMAGTDITDAIIQVDRGDSVSNHDEYAFSAVHTRTDAGILNAKSLGYDAYDDRLETLENFADTDLSERTRSHIERSKRGLHVSIEHLSYNGTD